MDPWWRRHGFRCLRRRELEGIVDSMNSKSENTALSEAERASLAWLKAQASTHNGQCVEIASTRGKIAIRDSKDPDGPILVYTNAEFKAFLDGARNGEFDRLVQ
jgi:Domain of unknown function (DUF397)